MTDFVKAITQKLKNNWSKREGILIEEVKRNSVDNVRLILAEAPECVNINSESGATPLLYAIQNNNLQMVELLLSKDADVHMQSVTGAVPILFAAQKGRTAIVKALLDNGANVNEVHAENASTPLIIAAQNGHLDIVRLLVDRGAMVNKANKFGVTPMHVAVKNEYNEIVIYLIEHGARRSKISENGHSPVSIANGKNSHVMKGLLHKWKFMEDKKGSKLPVSQMAKNNSTHNFMEGI